MLVEVDRATAFRVFTEEADLWWKSGFKCRTAGTGRSVVHLEPRVGSELRRGNERNHGDDQHRGWSRIRPDHPARHGLAVQAFIRMLGALVG